MTEKPAALTTRAHHQHQLCKSRLHNCSAMPEWKGFHAGIVQQAVGQMATSIVQQPVAQFPGRNGALTP